MIKHNIDLSSLSDEQTANLAAQVIQGLIASTRKSFPDGNGTAMISFTGNDDPFIDHFISVSVGPEAREMEAALHLAAKLNAQEEYLEDQDEPKRIYP